MSRTQMSANAAASRPDHARSQRSNSSSTSTAQMMARFTSASPFGGCRARPGAVRVGAMLRRAVLVAVLGALAVLVAVSPARAADNFYLVTGLTDGAGSCAPYPNVSGGFTC